MTKRPPKNKKLKIKRQEQSEPRDYGAFFKLAFKLFGIYFLFLGVFLVWREGYGWGVEQRWFDLKSIDVTGQVHTKQAEIIKYSLLKFDTPIFDIDTNKTTSQIEALPWVKKVKISRRLPDTLLIEITEHSVSGLVMLDRIYYVNEEGTPFKVAPKEAIKDHVLIEGLNSTNFENMSAGQKKVKMALQFIKIYNKHPLAKIAELKRVSHKYNGMEVLIGEHQTRLVLGKGNLTDVLDRALKLWLHLDKQGKVAKLMHLDNRDKPERVSVKLQAFKDMEQNMETNQN